MTTLPELPSPDALCRLTLTVVGISERTALTEGELLIVPVTGGVIDGPRFSGTVVDGEDRAVRHADGALRLNVTMQLRTYDGDLAILRYHGWRCGPPDVLMALEEGKDPNPDDYYLRIAGSIDSAAPRLGWLHGHCIVGTGRRPPTGPVYDLFLIH